MLKHGRAAVLTAIACVALALPAAAGEQGFNARFGLRAGVVPGSTQDNLDKRMLSYGVDFGYTTGVGRFGVELGFHHKGGQQYLQDPAKMEITKLPSGFQYDPESSVDSRKNGLNGLTMRFSFEKPINNEVSWRAGLMVARTKYTQEVIGLAGFVYGGQYFCPETFNTTKEARSTNISPYVGMIFHVNEYFSVETNILAYRYKALNYVHVGGGVCYTDDATGPYMALDRTETNSRTKAHLEVGMVFRF